MMNIKNIKARLIVLATAGCFMMIAQPAAAGDRHPISSLPLLPSLGKDAAAPTDAAKLGVAGVTMKERPGYGSGKILEARAATKLGYCLVSREWGLRMSAASSSSPLEDELWHFTESDDGSKATLERTRLEVLTPEKNLYAKSKSSVSLERVGQATGVTVWGMRESNGDIVLIARGGDSGREAAAPTKDDDGTIKFSSSDCTWGATRLSTQLAKGGAVAQLRGTLPPVGEGKQKVTPRWIVNSSLSKVSRDPEPILSIAITFMNS